jgi:hypothetical protein
MSREQLHESPTPAATDVRPTLFQILQQQRGRWTFPPRSEAAPNPRKDHR